MTIKQSMKDQAKEDHRPHQKKKKKKKRRRPWTILQIKLI